MGGITHAHVDPFTSLQSTSQLQVRTSGMRHSSLLLFDGVQRTNNSKKLTMCLSMERLGWAKMVGRRRHTCNLSNCRLGGRSDRPKRHLPSHRSLSQHTVRFITTSHLPNRKSLRWAHREVHDVASDKSKMAPDADGCAGGKTCHAHQERHFSKGKVNIIRVRQ